MKHLQSTTEHDTQHSLDAEGPATDVDATSLDAFLAESAGSRSPPGPHATELSEAQEVRSAVMGASDLRWMWRDDSR